VTDEIRQLADEEEVVVSVYIDEQELRNAVVDLKNADQQGNWPDNVIIGDRGAFHKTKFGGLIKSRSAWL